MNASEKSGSRVLKFVLLVAITLLVPVIPFALVGEQSERWITDNLLTGSALSQGSLWALVTVVLVLISDILLPVPSSGVMTFAGASLGWAAGTALCFVGLTLSCLVGYLIGRLLGVPVVRRFVDADELTAMTHRLDRTGFWILAAFRGVPVLAEASVLVAGVVRMSPPRFWLTVSVANLCIAAIYAGLGHFARGADWLAAALVISIMLPVALLLGWWVLRRF